MLRSLMIAVPGLVLGTSLAMASPPTSAPANATPATVILGQKQRQDACMKAHPNDHAAFKACLKKPDTK